MQTHSVIRTTRSVGLFIRTYFLCVEFVNSNPNFDSTNCFKDQNRNKDHKQKTTTTTPAPATMMAQQITLKIRKYRQNVLQFLNYRASQ